MAKIVHIHASKQPRRPHHIQDWAEKRNLSQADLVRELGADKSVVSRWYAGASPGKEWQMKLASFFDVDEEALFRHPDEDWLMRKFKRHSEEERERMRKTIEAAFPDKTG